MPETRTITELVVNPGFETNADGDKIPDGWQGKNLQATKSDKLKCNKTNKKFAYSGNCAFMFRGNLDGSSSKPGSKLQQKITATEALVNGAEVIFSAYVDARKVSPGTSFAKAVIKYTDGSKQKLELTVPVGEGYLHAVSSGVVGDSGVKKVKVQISHAETSGKLFLDDVSLSVRFIEPTATLISTTAIVETAMATASATVTLTEENPTVTATETAETVITEIPSSTPTATRTATSTATPLPGGIWRLTTNPPVAEDVLGFSTAISGDGNTIMASVNALSLHPPSTEAGSVYVFVRGGAGWRQQAILTASDAVAGDYFGRSISLSRDGNTALIGSENNDAYIFVRSGEVWTQQAKITASEIIPYASFGFEVSLSSDGNTALILNAPHIHHLANVGAVYVFTREGDVWTQQASLIPDQMEGDYFFAIAISLSGDGNRAAVTTVSNGSDLSVHLFDRTDTGWMYQTTLSENHISSVGAISLDETGSTLVIGSEWQTVEQVQNQGAAYVFARDGDDWTQQAVLTSGESEMMQYFGAAVSISSDGDTILIGAYGDSELIGDPTWDYPIQGIGAAYVFTRSGTDWTLYRKLTSLYPETTSAFGIAVGLSDDAGIAAIGSPFDYMETNLGGAVWVFTLS